MAVAAVLANRKGRRVAGFKEEEEPSYVEDKLPPVELWEEDMFLGLQTGGAWQRRRVVFTKAMIAFADRETMIDHILLAEVEFVREVGLMDDDLQVEHGKLENAIMISTVVHGRNSGRTYFLQAESMTDCNRIVATLSKSAAVARQKAEAKTRLASLKQHVKRFFDSPAFQGLSAVLILLNFIVSIVDAQFGANVVHDQDSQHVENPTISQLADMSGSFNFAFTVIFTVELLLNVFGNGFRRFVRSGWNWLDIFIVSMSLVDLFAANIPKWLVGLMRAIRVIRLFGRVKELKKMSTAVTASIFPMMNAFVILIVILCIFSILGVSLFSDLGPDEFGRFNRAFVTCFGMVTGNGWPESMPIVSVAVLIDNFVAASARLEHEAKMEIVMEKKKVNMYKNPLEPLVAKLAMSYIDRADLGEKLKALFQNLDSDGSGDLSSTEFCAAIRKLNFTPSIYMTEPDFQNLSKNGALCNKDGTIDCESFRNIMIAQIRAYTMTLLSVHSTFLTPEEEEFSRRGTLKMIMMDLQLQTQERQDKSSTTKEPSDSEPMPDTQIETPSTIHACAQDTFGDLESSFNAPFDTNRPASAQSQPLSQDDVVNLVRSGLAELRELMHSTCRYVCAGDEAAKSQLLEVWKQSSARDEEWRLSNSKAARNIGGSHWKKTKRSHKQPSNLTKENTGHRTESDPKLRIGEIQIPSSHRDQDSIAAFLTRWNDYIVQEVQTTPTDIRRPSHLSEAQLDSSARSGSSESSFSNRRLREHVATSTKAAADSSGEHATARRSSRRNMQEVSCVPPSSTKNLHRSSPFNEKLMERSPSHGITSTLDPNLDSSKVAARTSSHVSNAFQQSTGRLPLSRSNGGLFGDCASPMVGRGEYAPDLNPTSSARPLVTSRSLTSLTNGGVDEQYLHENSDKLMEVSNAKSAIHAALEGGDDSTRDESAMLNGESRIYDESGSQGWPPGRSSGVLSSPFTVIRAARAKPDRVKSPQPEGQAHFTTYRPSYVRAHLRRKSEASATDVVKSYRSKRDPQVIADSDATPNVHPASRLDRNREDPSLRSLRRRSELSGYQGWGNPWESLGLEGWGNTSSPDEFHEREARQGARQKPSRSPSAQAASGFIQPRRSDLVKVMLA